MAALLLDELSSVNTVAAQIHSDIAHLLQLQYRRLKMILKLICNDPDQKEFGYDVFLKRIVEAQNEKALSE
jgi:hypothetical protein